MAIRSIPGFDTDGNPIVRVVDDTNLLAVLSKAQQALSVNAAYLAHAPIPAGTLTTAQLSAIVRILSDQTDALARQVNGLILFLRGDFTDISGT